MAVATSSEQDFLSLIQDLRIDRLPCPDEVMGDPPTPKFVLASDRPERRLDRAPFVATLTTWFADPGTPIAGLRWVSGSFDPASGRGGALAPLTRPDLAWIPGMTGEAQPAAPSAADAAIVPPAPRAVPGDRDEAPERAVLPEGIRVAQTVSPPLPALTPAALLGPFEPPALPDRRSSRVF